MNRVVVVFGREPLPGTVKTRLGAEVGEEAAASVYRELLAHTLEVATAIDADAVLSLAEPPARDFRSPLEVAVEIQAVGDLGHRLAAAFERRFDEGYRRVVVIGSDCPDLASRHLEAAFEGLAEHQAVLGPAEDGGYWLVGLRAPKPELFENLPWSTVDVLEASRARLKALGMSWLELEELQDLDTGADLWRLLGRDGEAELIRRLRLALEELERGAIE